MSERERISWVGLIVNLVITVWYFEHILRLPAEADLWGPRTAFFAASLVILAVFVAIACEVALRVVQRGTGGGHDTAPQDERDVLIDLRATRNAHLVLGFGVIAVLVQLALLEWSQRYWRRPANPDTILELLGTGPLQAMHVAQLLLAALALAAFAQNASRIFYYRRGC